MRLRKYIPAEVRDDRTRDIMARFFNVIKCIENSMDDFHYITSSFYNFCNFKKPSGADGLTNINFLNPGAEIIDQRLQKMSKRWTLRHRPKSKRQLLGVLEERFGSIFLSVSRRILLFERHTTMRVVQHVCRGEKWCAVWKMCTGIQTELRD